MSNARGDQQGAEVKVQSFTLRKYEGDPPKLGEDKEPFEIIEGGDDRPTVVKRKINGLWQEVPHATG